MDREYPSFPELWNRPDTVGTEARQKMATNLLRTFHLTRITGSALVAWYESQTLHIGIAPCGEAGKDLFSQGLYLGIVLAHVFAYLSYLGFLQPLDH